MRKKLSGPPSSRIDNNSTNENSSESEEDYSQMARASNNYNILSFNRRFRVISTVKATDEEDFYEETGVGASIAERNDQDTYVHLALNNRHVPPILEDTIAEEGCGANPIVVRNDTNDNSYVTLVPNAYSSSAVNPESTPQSLPRTQDHCD
ncbi:uncharacterized protein LOC111137534 [Crassostrea virginica]